MSGKKGRSGGARPGAGAKKKGDLSDLHALIDEYVTDADWASIFKALLIKARKGNVAAFRELRACRYGQIPIAPVPTEDAAIMVTQPGWLRPRDDIPKESATPPNNPLENKPRPTVPSST